MSEPLARILDAKSPLTLASVPTGFLPWLAADLTRAAYGTGKSRRVVIIAADEAAMRALTDTITAFAPEAEVLGFPAWDCLPYDRASPALRVMAERMATLHALQLPLKSPQVLVTTVNAATQRALTPFRIRQFTRRLAEGDRIERDRLAALLRPTATSAAIRSTMRANMRCVDRSWTCFRLVRRRPSGSISSATRSKRCATSTPLTRNRPARPRPSP